MCNFSLKSMKWDIVVDIKFTIFSVGMKLIIKYSIFIIDTFRCSNINRRLMRDHIQVLRAEFIKNCSLWYLSVSKHSLNAVRISDSLMKYVYSILLKWNTAFFSLNAVRISDGLMNNLNHNWKTDLSMLDFSWSLIFPWNKIMEPECAELHSKECMLPDN